MKSIHEWIGIGLILLVAGCAIHPRKGFYEGSKVPEWSHSIPSGSGGVNYYLPTKAAPLYVQVTFSTTAKGEIYMNIYCDPHSPVFASEKKIIVTFNDGNQIVVEPQQSVGISVSPSDAFTIAVPPFRVNGMEFPELVAAFKWNESTRYYIRGIQ